MELNEETSFDYTPFNINTNKPNCCSQLCGHNSTITEREKDQHFKIVLASDVVCTTCCIRSQIRKHLRFAHCELVDAFPVFTRTIISGITECLTRSVFTFYNISNIAKIKSMHTKITSTYLSLLSRRPLTEALPLQKLEIGKPLDILHPFAYFCP